MKLLILTASTAFKGKIKEILQKSGVRIFSYKKVTGYRDLTEEAISTNWFTTEMNENDSTLFYAFTKTENVDLVFKKVAELNLTQDTLSKVHIAVINIEKSNNYDE